MSTANVAVIWRLSSIPLMCLVLVPEGMKAYLPGETYDEGAWSRLTAKSIGISPYSITF